MTIERGIIMTNTATTTTNVLSAKAFKMASFDAYMQYVGFIQGSIDAETAVEAMAPLFSAYGFNLTINNICNVLTIRMTAYGSVQGEKSRKVKSIGVFRNFIKEGWREVEASPVTFNAGKDPHVTTPRKKTGMTKADLEAKVAELTAMLTAMAANNEESVEVKAEETVAA